MSNNNSAPTPVPAANAHRRGAVIFGVFVAIMMTLLLTFVMTAGARAASGPGSMQKSMASHGVNVDAVTAERVRVACVQSGVVTTDVIAEFQGSKQVVTVQCGGNDDISDAIVRTFAPAVTK